MSLHRPRLVLIRSVREQLRVSLVVPEAVDAFADPAASGTAISPGAQGQRVAPLARRTQRLSAASVFDGRHLLQVLGVYAPLDEAAVVDLLAGKQLPDQQLIDHAV